MRLLKPPKTNGENNHFLLPLYFKFSPLWTNWKSMIKSLIISVSCVVLCTRENVLDLYQTLTTNFIIFTKLTNANVANILNVFKMPQFHGIIPILYRFFWCKNWIILYKFYVPTPHTYQFSDFLKCIKSYKKEVFKGATTLSITTRSITIKSIT